MTAPRRLRSISVFLVFLGIAYLLLGLVTISVAMFAVAGVGFWISRRTRAQNIAVQHLNQAWRHVSLGQLDEAEAELAAIDRAGMVANIPRVVSVYRAAIALQRGNPRKAIEEASKATSEKVGILIPEAMRVQRASALAFRALAYAAVGETSAAERDARDTEQIAEAPPEAIARARLAQAVVFSRTGDDAALTTALSENADLFAEYGDARARVLTRALARMVRERRKHVYREPAKVAETNAPSELAGWVEGLAPEAAAYIDAARVKTGSDEAASAPVAPTAPALAPADDVKTIEKARKQASKKNARWSWSRRLVLLAMYFFSFVVVWQYLAPNDSQRLQPTNAAIGSTLANAHAARPLDWMWSTGAAGTMALVLFFGAYIPILRRRMRRKNARLAMARRHIALGNAEAALPVLEAIARDRNTLFAGSATFEIVRLAAHDARYAFVAEQCERAIPKLVPFIAKGANLLVPGLATELAVARAAMGQIDKARAELAIIERDFASFPFLMIARTRILSMCEVASGNFDGAATIASQRPAESALPRREELLGDLAMAAVWGAEDSERERLEAEMANPAMRGWVQAVAPSLIGMVGQIRKRAPIARIANTANR
ncbi:MAG: hypothetical protein FWD73_17585 [Polyangiaceae bacterium]|nr:hypothetical protein [Polyangiaceae bacterium]